MCELCGFPEGTGVFSVAEKVGEFCENGELSGCKCSIATRDPIGIRLLCSFWGKGTYLVDFPVPRRS